MAQRSFLNDTSAWRGSFLKKYIHTGVLLRIGQDEFIVEVQKEESINKIATIIRKWSEIEDYGDVWIDNTYLKAQSIKMNDLLY